MPTNTEARPAGSSKGSSSRRRSRRLDLSEKIAICGLLGLVSIAVLAFGASDVGVAILFACLYAAYLLVLLLTCDWARREFVRLKGLRTSAVLFAVLLAVALWPLTPWGPGGAHPAWSYLGRGIGSLTVDRSALILNVLQLLGLGALFLAGRIVGASETRTRWLLRAAVLAIGVYAAAAILEHVGVRRTSRLAATLLSPNSAATMFGAGLLMTLGFTALRLHQGQGRSLLRHADPMAMLGAGVAAVLMVALLLTTSRSGLAATLLAAALFLIWEAISQRRGLRANVILGLTAVTLLMAVLSFRSVEAVAERFSQAQHDSSVRGTIFAAHWEAFLTSPWSGFGLGSFPTVNQLITTRENLPALFNVRAAHNLYLQWLEEAGLIGSLIMAALFASLVWPILSRGFRQGGMGIWCRATLCASLVFLVHGATDFALQTPAIQAVATLMLGVIGGLVAERLSGRAAFKVQQAPAWVMVGGTFAITLLIAVVAIPLTASKFEADLSAWPTAPADVLARAIETGLDRPGLSVERLKRLDRLSARELSMRPASGAAWLRRAAVDQALGHQESANLALERSFAVAPLQTSLFNRRTVFAYEHWDRLSPSAREQTIYQLSTEWERQRVARPFVAMANRVANPAGRVGLALQIAVLRLQTPLPSKPLRSSTGAPRP